MAHAPTNLNTVPNKFVVSASLKTFSVSAVALGVLFFVMGMINNQERTWHAYLIALFYFASLSIGGLFFTAIQHLSKAGWSSNVRRLCESFSSFLPWAFVGSLVLLVAGHHLYEWLDPKMVAADPLLAHKTGYLNLPFFVIRLVVFFGLWMVFHRIMVGRSLKQDETGDHELTRKQTRTSIAFLMTFAISYSFYSVDTLMSLQPHWFSTIFGVYCFAGLFQSTMAVMILLTVYLINKGYLKNHVNENHLHDLGKFMFAFTVFWAYIAFSQYMLIWYANLPEETIFYMPRMVGSWLWVSILLLLFKFIVPFIALLPRSAKRNPTYLSAVSILILVMQYVDLYWLVYPNLSEEKTYFGLYEIFIFLGFAGAFVFVITRFLSKHPLIPLKDPFRHESEAHHVTY